MPPTPTRMPPLPASSDWSPRRTTACASSRSTPPRCRDPCRTPDSPASRRTPAAPTRSATAAHGWDVRQRVVAADDDAGTALQIRDELERGTTSILLDLTSTASIDADRLDAMLDGVHLELITIVLDADARLAGRRGCVGRGVVPPRSRPGRGGGRARCGPGRRLGGQRWLDRSRGVNRRDGALGGAGRRAVPERHDRARRRIAPPRVRGGRGRRVGLRPGARCPSPAHADRCRARRRRRRPPTRVPLRRHAGPVLDDRQAAGGPAALAPRRRRGWRRRQPPAPARRDVAGGHGALRHVGQRAALDGRLLRRRRRRRRCRDRRPPRRSPRAGRLADRTPAGPQHPARARRGVEPRPGRRHGRRVVVRRAPHRGHGAGGVGGLPGHRAGRRHRCRPARRAGAGAAGPHP